MTEPVALGSRLATNEVDRRMTEMERVFHTAGDHTGRQEALSTLRRLQLDPRMDSASRQRASALVWRFQANGWDEV